MTGKRLLLYDTGYLAGHFLWAQLSQLAINVRKEQSFACSTKERIRFYSFTNPYGQSIRYSSSRLLLDNSSKTRGSLVQHDSI
jgi:hypothetical protein